ncbi:MAG: chemotaxis protein CheW [Rhizobiaceae bacterium]|jgi:purine-binding chemotaxis protein CheW
MSSDDMRDATTKRELIAFRIGEQEFCVDITTVREIRGFVPATPLPHAPAYVNGVINLRGTVLPVIDLGLRMGLARIEPTARSVIVVAKMEHQLFGLLVDAVSDILTVTDEAIQPTPNVASELAQSFVRGVIALEGRMISLIAAEAIPPRQLDMAA